MLEGLKNQKKRTTLLIWASVTTVIITLTVIITAYYINNKLYDEKQQMTQAYESVFFTYNEAIRDTVQFFTARANANLHLPGVLESIRAKDHDALHNLILPQWEVLQEENPYLIVMQFHNADGTSLLRMHDVQRYGDPIAAKRPMVHHIHQSHKITYGLEEGIHGIAFRILIPIIDHGRYLGALEFGISSRYIIEKIERYTHYKSFLLLNRDYIGNFSFNDHYFRFDGYVAVEIPHELMNFVKYYSNEHSAIEDNVMVFNKISYAMKYIPIVNYSGDKIGMIVFTRIIPNFKVQIEKNIVISGLIAISLILIFGFLINRIYARFNAKIVFQELYNQTVLNTIPSPVIVTNGNEAITANKAFFSFFHYITLEHFQHDHVCVCDYFEKGDTEEYLLPTVNGLRWTEYVYLHPQIHHKAKITIDGKPTVFDVKISRMQLEEEFRYVVIFTDISSIQALTTTDQLTDIANRMHFSMVFEHELNVLRREKEALGVIFFDIDHFKLVNDRHGHLVGDTILRHVAALVKKQIRKSDFIARWGGEEFVILLPRTHLQETRLVAEMLRQTIEREHFESVGSISCSFGVAALEEDESPEALLRRVDRLLYRAKESGRNCVVA